MLINAITTIERDAAATVTLPVREIYFILQGLYKETKNCNLEELKELHKNWFLLYELVNTGHIDNTALDIAITMTEKK